MSKITVDGTARIWTPSEQCQLAEVRIDASLRCAAFHPATGRLLAASAAGVAMVAVDDNHTAR